MHNGIAAAEDRDSYADVEQRLFQSCPEPFLTVGLLTRHRDQAARLELFSPRGAL
jgi:hypothetical protein